MQGRHALRQPLMHSVRPRQGKAGNRYTYPDFDTETAALSSGMHTVLVGPVVPDHNRAATTERPAGHQMCQARPLVHSPRHGLDNQLSRQTKIIRMQGNGPGDVALQSRRQMGQPAIV